MTAAGPTGAFLELRTPFVDATLLSGLAPLTASFAGRAGKTDLANAPGKPLPRDVTGRRKSGFSIPMASWLRAHRDPRGPRTSVAEPWARQWARMLIANGTACG